MAFNRAAEDCPKEWSPARLAMGAYGEQVTVTRVRLWPMMTPVEAALDEAMREARAEKDRAP